MLTVFGALVPVFLLIVLGYRVAPHAADGRSATGSRLEQLVYYVLFPALLIDTLARANLATVPIAGVGGALLLAVLAMSALCLALRPWLARDARRRRPGLHLGVSGRHPLADVCGAVGRRQSVGRDRHHAGVGGDGGDDPAAERASRSGCWRITPRRSGCPGRISCSTIAKNPLIWACVIGLAINLSGFTVPRPMHEFADALGRCSLALGLLMVGAGLHLESLRRPRAPALITVGAQAGGDAADRHRTRPRLRPVRHEPGGGRLLRLGAERLERLHSRAPDGRRRAAAGADPHVADRCSR